jgi:hypothetical protein
MRRPLASIVVGFVAASSLFVFAVMPVYGRETVAVGRKQGEVNAKFELMRKVSETLGEDYSRADGYNTVIEVKDGAVVAVERNGIKTVRTYR